MDLNVNVFQCKASQTEVQLQGEKKIFYKMQNTLHIFKTATLLSAYLWLRLTPARVMVSVAYEPWNTNTRELEEFNIELKKWGADTKLGEATFYLFSSVRI